MRKIEKRLQPTQSTGSGSKLRDRWRYTNCRTSHAASGVQCLDLPDKQSNRQAAEASVERLAAAQRSQALRAPSELPFVLFRLPWYLLQRHSWEDYAET